MKINYLKLLVSLLLVSQISSLAFAQAASLLSSVFQSIVSIVQTVIGVFAIALFMVGGVLYAAAHFLPAAGQIKANMQGWAMGMIIGSIVGLILVLIAPYLVGLIQGI
ncbi:MAG: hypothetical protein ACP5K9_01435 [Candidatus Micrarchaeia archaeon]